MKKPLAVRLVTQSGTRAVCFEMAGHAAVLEAAEVDELIEVLAVMRSDMRPAVPRELSRSHQYVMENDPSWYSERPPLIEGATLFLRHSGLGWVSFSLSTESLRKLGVAVARHVCELEEQQAHLVLN